MKIIKLFFIICLTFLSSFKTLNAEETTLFFNNFSGICVNSIHDLELIKNFSKLEEVNIKFAQSNSESEPEAKES